MAKVTGEDAVARRVSGDIVEQRTGRRLAMLQQLRCEADIFLPRRAIDAAQLPELFDFVDIIAKVVIGHIMLQRADLSAVHGGIPPVFDRVSLR